MTMHGDAIFNGPNFRLQLDRWWDEGPRALVGMLNPSKAGAEENDPTILNLVKLVRALGFPGFTAVNRWSYIATDPKDLHAWRWNYPRAEIRAHKMNLGLIRDLAPRAAVRIVAWGNGVPSDPKTQEFLQALSCNGAEPVMCFGKTKSGAPIHPMARGKMRLVPGTPLQPFEFGVGA